MYSVLSDLFFNYERGETTFYPLPSMQLQACNWYQDRPVSALYGRSAALSEKKFLNEFYYFSYLSQ